MRVASVASASPDVLGLRLEWGLTRHVKSYANILTSTRLWRQLTGKMTSLILPSADTEMMSLFLDHVSKTFAKYFVVMQVDRAGWHQAKELKIPANMRLIAQPAYSPELNPVEHVWEEVREKHLANLAFASLDEVIDKVCDGLNQLEADPERLRSMTYFPHFRSSS
jgi:hypothetical protein